MRANELFAFQHRTLRQWWLVGLVAIVWCMPHVQAKEPKGAFHHLHVNAPIHVELIQGAQANIEIPTAWSTRLSSEVVDDVLYIEVQGSTPLPATTEVVRITVPSLRSMHLSQHSALKCAGLTGSELVIEGDDHSRFHLQGLDIQDLVVQGRGLSSFVLSGVAEHQTIDLVGVGEYFAHDLITQTSQVDVHGAGRVELHAGQLLDVSISGLARVFYDGSPWISQRILGQATLQRF